MIEQLLEIQQQPIVSLQSKEAAYQVKLSTYGSLQGVLETLQSAMEELDDVSDLTLFSASSGDTDLFTVSADETAAPGAYDVTVQQLAEAHKLTSEAFSEDETVGEGTLSLQVGDGAATDIAVSATDTIDDVAQAINDAEVGVQATVIFDGTDYFLTLTAETTGADNVINLTATDTGDDDNTDDSGLSRLVYDQGVTSNLTNTQTATDAIITVDGVTDIHRGSNTIDDVLQGVTLTLVSAPDASDNQTTLTVSRDTDAVVSKISSFVAAYNQANEFFETAQGYDADTEVAGVLIGDNTTNNIRNSLRNTITNAVSGIDAFSYLADLGIALNSDGDLEVDDETLTGALDDHFDDVRQFFTQSTDGAQGVAVRMIETLEAAIDDTDGSLTVRTDGIQDSIDDIGEQVERIEMRNESWETRTRAQFNALELLLAEYQTTGDYLTQQIAGFQTTNNYISNL
jgi:flagellar hook-associated protein 2